jgi:integrase
MNGVDIPDPDVCVMDYVPTQRDYEAIIKTAYDYRCSKDLINLIGACRYSGLRINEILKWRIEDIVLCPDDSSIPYFWADISKQKRKTRIAVPMVAQLARILRDQISGYKEGYVFPWRNPPYKLFQIAMEDGSVESLYDLAKVNVPRPFHDFRKTFKMDLKRSGYSKEVTKSMMGHATDAMDDWYTHFKRADLEDAVKHTYEGSNGNEFNF